MFFLMSLYAQLMQDYPLYSDDITDMIGTINEMLSEGTPLEQLYDDSMLYIEYVKNIAI